MVLAMRAGLAGIGKLVAAITRAALLCLLCFTAGQAAGADEGKALKVLGQYCLATVEQRPDANVAPRHLGPWSLSPDGSKLAYWIYRSPIMDTQIQDIIASAQYSLWLNGRMLQAETERGLHSWDTIGRFTADSSRYVYVLGADSVGKYFAGSVWVDDIKISPDFDAASDLAHAPVGNSVAYIATAGTQLSVWRHDAMLAPEFGGEFRAAAPSAKGLSVAYMRRYHGGVSVWLNGEQLSPNFSHGYLDAVAISPDGANVAYIVVDDRSRQGSIWLNNKRLASGVHRLNGIRPQARGLHFSHDGLKLYYVAQGNKPENVAVWENDRQLSPDARSIQALELTADRTRISYLLESSNGEWSVYVNGEQRSLPFRHRPQGFAVSPNGEDVVVTHFKVGQSWRDTSWAVWRNQVLVEEADVKEARGPVLSPDGSRLVYLVKQSDKWSLREAGKRVGAEHDEIVFHGFSPDGKKLFVIGRDQGKVAVWENGTKSSPDFEEIKNFAQPTQPPRYLLFSADGTSSAYVVRSKQQESLWLNGKKASDDFAAIGGVVLSADGKHLAYLAQQARQSASEPARWAIWLDGKKYTPDFSDLEQFTLSPDGRHLLYVTGRAGQPALHAAARDTQGEQTVWLDGQKLSPAFDAVAYLAFSPDGSQAYYVAADGIRQSVWRDGKKVAPAGERSWEQFRKVKRGLSWSPDGRTIGFAARRGSDWEVWVNDRAVVEGLSEVWDKRYSAKIAERAGAPQSYYVVLDDQGKHVLYQASRAGTSEVWRDANPLAPSVHGSIPMADQLRFAPGTAQSLYRSGRDYWRDGKRLADDYPDAESVLDVTDSADGKHDFAIVQQQGKASVWRDKRRVSPDFDKILWFDADADSKHVAYAGSSAGRAAIWINERRVSPEFDATELSLFAHSPDGQQVAYVEHRANKYQVWLNDKRLGNAMRYPNLNPARPYFGRNGQIAYLVQQGSQYVLYMDGVAATPAYSQIAVAWQEFKRNGELVLAVERDKDRELLHVRVNPTGVTPAALREKLKRLSTCPPPHPQPRGTSER